jgi:isoleucyl-tRNA synthetase
MSSLYLDILKDRLYASAPDAVERRAAQTVIHRVLDGLLRLMAPILSFTTAEAWEHLHGDGAELPAEQSVFFASFPETDDIPLDEGFSPPGINCLPYAAK